MAEICITLARLLWTSYYLVLFLSILHEGINCDTVVVLARPNSFGNRKPNSEASQDSQLNITSRYPRKLASTATQQDVQEESSIARHNQVSSSINLDVSDKDQGDVTLPVFVLKSAQKKYKHLANDYAFISRDQSKKITQKYDDFKLTTCSELCEDINQWDELTAQARICDSFSYCQDTKQCVVIIKTNFRFRNPNFTPASNVIPHPIDLNDLIENGSSACNIYSRLNMAKYYGPLATEPKYSRPELIGYEHEWLAAQVDSGSQRADIVDDCALKCSERNRIGRVCAAIDICETSRLGLPLKRYETEFSTVCNILLVEGGRARSTSGVNMLTSDELETIRNDLITQASLKTVETVAETTKQVAKLPEEKCTRYIAPPTTAFKEIANDARQLDVLNLRDYGTEIWKVNNVTTCATKCMNKQGFKCLAFEYCRQQRGFEKIESTEFERVCHLYSRKDGFVLESLPEEGIKSALGFRLSTQASPDVNGCRFFVRNELVPKLDRGVLGEDWAHMNIMIAVFCICYAALASATYLFIVRLNRLQRLRQQTIDSSTQLVGLPPTQL